MLDLDLVFKMAAAGVREATITPEAAQELTDALHSPHAA